MERRRRPIIPHPAPVPCAAIDAERPLQVAGAINAYCAMMAEQAGFRAVYLSGRGRGERFVWIARSGDHHIK